MAKARPTTTIKFSTDTWDEIENLAGAKIGSERGWYCIQPDEGEPVRFLYGFWITIRDGVWSASETKPRGV